jgi:hypothetical protein
VYLINARHVKGVLGKKTDLCDAQWLQQLHAAGLLRKSIRAALGIVPLRFIMRATAPRWLVTQPSSSSSCRNPSPR